jgi:hypothetical protein
MRRFEWPTIVLISISAKSVSNLAPGGGAARAYDVAPSNVHAQTVEVTMRRLSVVIVLSLCGLLRSSAATAEETRFHASLRGFNEVPATASLGTAQLSLRIESDTMISFTLSFADLSGPPAAAHVHFGAKATNGGVSFFFCGGGGKPACPSSTSGTITGVVQAADVVGPAAQGIAAGDLADIIRAIRHRVAYANMHTAKFPAGEIRGQVLGHSEERGDDDD